jgi:integrase
MASLYRPMSVRYVVNGSRRDAEGKPVTKDTPGACQKRERSRIWRVKYKDEAGKDRSASLRTEDRDEAQERLADFLRKQKRGESDPYAAHLETPLSEHLDDFRRYLEAKNSSSKHVDKTVSYVSRVFKSCRFNFIKNLDANSVADYLHDRRKPVPVALLSLKQAAIALANTVGLPDTPLTRLKQMSRSSLPAPDTAAQRGTPARWNWATLRPILQQEFGCNLPRQCPLPDEPGLSIAGSNDYVASLKNFANWMVRSRRIPENPFRYLRKLNADTDPRHPRRPADSTAFERLLSAASVGKPFRGLTGRDRCMLYLVATMTGFRASELASLSENSFDLGSDVPCVRVRAAYSKRRRNDSAPLREDFVELLREYIQDLKHRRTGNTLSIRGDDELMWPGSWSNKAAEMLRVDLEAAAIPYQDHEGLFLDFHALRHTFGTNLAKAGVQPKVAQELLRHSDVKLTLNTYTHVGLYDLAGAVEKLPEFSGHAAEIKAARTGTDSVVAPVVALKTGNIGNYQGLSDGTDDQSGRLSPLRDGERKPIADKEFTSDKSAHKNEPPMRLELMTYALRKRRSAN